MNNTPWYDDISVMVNHCHDLKSLNELLIARIEGSKVNGERKAILNEFVVGGKWYLDKFGQVQLIQNILKDYQDISDAELPVFPAIMTFKEFQSLIENHFKPNIMIRSSIGGSSPLSIGYGNVCKHCRKPLTLEDALMLYDESSISITKQQINALVGDFSNFTIKELTDRLTNVLHAKVRLFSNNTMYDGKLELEAADKVDKAAYWSYSHMECHVRDLNERTRQQLTDALTKSGITVHGSIRTENKYGPEMYYGSWFIFDTSIGFLTLGWRKRVINIDYSQIDPKYIADTEETKGPGFEHVWSYDKLTEALVKFKEHHHKLSQK